MFYCIEPVREANYIQQNSTLLSQSKTAINNVRVFDGFQLRAPSTVVIDGGVIGVDPTNAIQVDGKGCVLMPGLIESHAHPGQISDLEQLSAYGVTTVMDQGCANLEACSLLRNIVGLVDFHSSGQAAIAPGSLHAQFPGVNLSELVDTPQQGIAFVERRISGGFSEYIKMIAETPGPNQPTLDAIAIAAKQSHLLVGTHATEHETYLMAQRAHSDIIHHVPLDTPLNDTENLRRSDHVAVPTLAAAEAIVGTNNSLRQPGDNIRAAFESVRALHRAGITILAGTDAHSILIAPVPFGDSMHTELELLVEAGLSNVEALRAATVVPAQVWGLWDRGVVEVGRRADLILIDGDPLVDIKATRKIQKIWIRGVEYVAN